MKVSWHSHASNVQCSRGGRSLIQRHRHEIDSSELLQVCCVYVSNFLSKVACSSFSKCVRVVRVCACLFRSFRGLQGKHTEGIYRLCPLVYTHRASIHPEKRIRTKTLSHASTDDLKIQDTTSSSELCASTNKE